MQELNHHPKVEIETESSYLNATSESCQLANHPSLVQTEGNTFDAPIIALHTACGS